MPTALIAEDEPLLAQALQAELARAWPELQVLRTVGDGASAVKAALEARLKKGQKLVLEQKVRVRAALVPSVPLGGFACCVECFLGWFLGCFLCACTCCGLFCRFCFCYCFCLRACREGWNCAVASRRSACQKGNL